MSGKGDKFVISLACEKNETSIESGLDFILTHLESDKQFPRRISTYFSDDKKIMVNSKAEALLKFRESNLLDSKISAFRYPVPAVRGINAQVPDFFMSDLDRRDKRFKTNKAFKQCLQQTLQNYDIKLHGANPTVLWSGGGFTLLQPLEADVILEMESIYSEFDEPSRKLMHYAEKLMTDNNADLCHKPSFENCMIRIPGSYNSKYVQRNDNDEIVSMTSQSTMSSWDGYKPNVRYLKIFGII